MYESSFMQEKMNAYAKFKISQIEESSKPKPEESSHVSSKVEEAPKLKPIPEVKSSYSERVNKVDSQVNVEKPRDSLKKTPVAVKEKPRVTKPDKPTSKVTSYDDDFFYEDYEEKRPVKKRPNNYSSPSSSSSSSEDDYSRNRNSARKPDNTRRYRTFRERYDDERRGGRFQHENGFGKSSIRVAARSYDKENFGGRDGYVDERRKRKEDQVKVKNPRANQSDKILEDLKKKVASRNIEKRQVQNQHDENQAKKKVEEAEEEKKKLDEKMDKYSKRQSVVEEKKQSKLPFIGKMPLFKRQPSKSTPSKANGKESVKDDNIADKEESSKKDKITENSDKVSEKNEDIMIVEKEVVIKEVVTIEDECINEKNDSPAHKEEKSFESKNTKGEEEEYGIIIPGEQKTPKTKSKKSKSKANKVEMSTAEPEPQHEPVLPNIPLPKDETLSNDQISNDNKVAAVVSNSLTNSTFSVISSLKTAMENSKSKSTPSKGVDVSTPSYVTSSPAVVTGANINYPYGYPPPRFPPVHFPPKPGQ